MTSFFSAPARHPWLRFTLRLLLTLVLLLITVWGIFALAYQAPAGTRRALLLLGWCALALAAQLAVWLPPRWLQIPQPRWAITAFVLAFAGVLAWWQTLTPSHERLWADDVAHMLHADVDGSEVTLHNVRNFDWRSETDYTARWETRRYNLDDLVSADLILSYWMGPAVAHTLVSFGFSDGQKLVFSVEIRKEDHEQFSGIAGFFRQYETVLVAADERDIVRVRTNVRGEDVYLYRLAIPPPALRTLFLAYLDEARELEREPRFYNTLTSNCTTIVFALARQIAPALPTDYRLLASGYLAEYARDHNGLVPGVDFPTLKSLGRITQRALDTGNADDFSRAIRAGVPGTEADPQPAS